jgi:hypothetical protein
VPAESTRLQRRLRARDRWFVGVVAGAAVIGTPIAVVAVGHGAAPPPGCVTTLRPGFMGGQTGTYCGKRAAAICRREGAGDASLASACRREGFAVGSTP